ncbi:unnamed protein product [Gongylonema pulchrum]|uniref:Uncharacterized protein n=1 Tax=Gongylonema pulchrum TaxID=637853 RepID=A0A3P7N5W9_9BILA|nr:unnamed protein product [Gongylonema pulchrum]
MVPGQTKIFINYNCRNSPSDIRASLRAARSASLISFVTKSVEEFRNGVLRSWRHCAPNMHEQSVRNCRSAERHSTATAIATELVRRRGLTSFLATDQCPSTVMDECVDDGVSLSSDSYRFFGFYEDEQTAEEEALPKRVLKKRTMIHGSGAAQENMPRVTFDTNGMERKVKEAEEDKSDELRSLSSAGWSDEGGSGSSASSSSLHKDRSRYDNVAPGVCFLPVLASQDSASHLQLLCRKRPKMNPGKLAFLSQHSLRPILFSQRSDISLHESSVKKGSFVSSPFASVSDICSRNFYV